MPKLLLLFELAGGNPIQDLFTQLITAAHSILMTSPSSFDKEISNARSRSTGGNGELMFRMIFMRPQLRICLMDTMSYLWSIEAAPLTVHKVQNFAGKPD